MKRPLVVEFTKMNGAGNDFVVLDNRFYAFTPAELGRLAARLCRRTESVGADGLLALDAGADGAAFRMHYHNADGSRATMCGNGARCLARFAADAGLGAGGRLVFDTDAGRHTADVPAGDDVPVRLHVPAPRDLHPVALPDVGGLGPDATFVWTGTEHAVLFADDARAVPLAEAGPVWRRADVLGPAGANANVVEVLSDGTTGPARLRVRTFEKGVEAETKACGTGALAAAVVARVLGRVASVPVAVEMPGGTLTVAFAWPVGAPVEDVTGLTLEGPAEVTFRGTVELATADIAGGGP